MLYFLYVLTFLSMLWVVATLVIGATSMGKGGDEARIKSNKWMTRRVWAQALAIGLLFITVYFRKNSGG